MGGDDEQLTAPTDHQDVTTISILTAQQNVPLTSYLPTVEELLLGNMSNSGSSTAAPFLFASGNNNTTAAAVRHLGANVQVPLDLIQ